jgi:hypothetical protein
MYDDVLHHVISEQRNAFFNAAHYHTKQTNKTNNIIII